MDKFEYGVCSCIILIVIIFVVAAIYETSYKEKQIMQNKALAILEIQSNDVSLKIDRFGELYKYAYIIKPEYREAIVTSAGRDMTFGTYDDIVVKLRDTNKSRLVGEYLGEKAKEAIKGVIKGVKKESKYESP